MNRKGRPPSRRFTPPTRTQRLVPLILGLLILALTVTLIIILLSVVGLTPAT